MALTLEKVLQDRLQCLKPSFSLQHMCSPNEEHNKLVSHLNYSYLQLARMTREEVIKKDDKNLKLYADVLAESQASWEKVRTNFAPVDPGSINETQCLKHRNIRGLMATRVRWYAQLSGDEEGKQLEAMNFNKTELEFLILSLQMQISKLPRAEEADRKMENDMMKEDIKGADDEELVYFMNLSDRNEKDEMREVIREEMEKRKYGKDGHLYNGFFNADLKEGAKFLAGDDVSDGVTTNGKSHVYPGVFNFSGQGTYGLGNNYKGKQSSGNGE